MPAPGFDIALRALAPEDIVPALEICHPALDDPLRLAVSPGDRDIAGQTYTAIALRLKMADDRAGRAPRAELRMDNVGREAMAWIARSGGGAGASVRIMLCLADGDSRAHPPDWERTLDVLGIEVTAVEIVATLGYDPGLDRAAVALRYEPATAPGLF